MLCLALSDIRDPSTPGYHCLGAYVLSFCHYSGLRTCGMLVVALHMTMAYCRVLRSRQDPFRRMLSWRVHQRHCLQQGR